MSPRLLLLLLCGLGVSLVLAQARVGETRPQVDARFHGPGKEIGDQVLYADEERGWSVTVFYTGGAPARPDGTGGTPAKATMEIYGHRAAPDGTKPDLAPDEVAALLADEGGGQEWTKLDKGGVTTWRRADNQLFARFQEADQVMVFLSREHRPVAGKPSVLLQDGKTAP